MLVAQDQFNCNHQLISYLIQLRYIQVQTSQSLVQQHLFLIWQMVSHFQAFLSIQMEHLQLLPQVNQSFLKIEFLLFEYIHV